MSTLLHAVAQFVTSYRVPLRLISYVLFGISGVFGAKALGRFAGVTESGGFYTAVLVALPGVAFIAAILLGFDTLSGFGVTQGLRTALHWSQLTPQGIAITAGAVQGAIPPFLRAAQHYAAKGSAKTWQSVHYTADVITAIVIAFGLFITLAIGARAVFVVDGWLGGTPPPSWALFAVALVGGAAFIIDAHRSAQQRKGTLTSAASFTWFLIVVIAIAGLVCFGLIAGWIVLIYAAVNLIAAYSLAALRQLAERLSPAQLVAIFSFPGVVGGIIQYLLAFPGVIPL